MCLHRKYNKKEKEEWLEDESETITAYKVVKIDSEKFNPLFYNKKKPFERRNRLAIINREIKCGEYCQGEKEKTLYIPYYHLFKNIKDAINYGRSIASHKVIKCTIPKELITDVGTQFILGSDGIVVDESTVIVTRGFDIVLEDKYLT